MTSVVTVNEQAALTVTTQAAEKIYRSRGGHAEVKSVLRLADSAALAWLPQETILFDGARLMRRIVADLVGSARLLACESLIFGRAARRETLRSGMIHDAWRVSHDGKLIWADGFRLEGDIEGELGRPALLDGRHALATAVYVGHDAGSWLEPVRGWLEVEGVRAGVSHRPGMLVMRLIADAAQHLRGAMSPVLSRLRAEIGAGPQAMPGVWAC
jgi:urease accessory protein